MNNNCLIRSYNECYNISMTTDEWLTIAEASKYIKLSIPSIRNYLKSGKLPTYRMGRTIRLKRSDLDALFKKS
jgi:excisionase family DNA binding protein